MKTSFFREHRGILPIVFVALVSSGYLACFDETIDPTPIGDAGSSADASSPKDDGAVTDAHASDGSGAVDGTVDAPADAPEDAPEDALDDSPTSNGG